MLTHKGTQPIRTPRLLLRRFTADDAQAMYDNWASDPLTTRFLSWEPHVSPEATRLLLESWVVQYIDNCTYNWVIVYEGQPVGNIGVHNLSDRNQNGEIGYCCGPRYWNLGIMTEALRGVIAFLFNEVGLHRVCAMHDAENAASGRVMQKAGMLCEGTLRQKSLRKDGSFGDLRVYSCLRGEWRGNI